MFFFCIAQKDRLIRAFIPVLGAMIIWTASAVFMSIQLYPGVLFWDRIMVSGMILVTFLLYYFVSVFTNSLSIFRTLFWGIGTFTFIGINFSGMIVTDAGVIANTVTLWGRQLQVIKFNYTLGALAVPLLPLHWQLSYAPF
jgi:hypothetical protein